MKKLIFFLYSVVAYVLFLSTFCYLVGFIGGLFVPRQVDGDPTKPLALALLIDTLLIALFAVQHSVMARPWFKQWWTTIIPEPIERSTYVLLSSACLIILFVLWQPVGGSIWVVESSSVSLALKAISVGGFVLAVVSTFLINHFDLVGLRQTWMFMHDQPYRAVPFKVVAFYKYVRHPLYLGLLVGFWVTPNMTAAHLFFALLNTAYILSGIRFEEKDLETAHGTLYTTYRQSAPALIPFAKKKQSTAISSGAEVATAKSVEK